MAIQNLIVGSTISFQLKSSVARYTGTVYFFDPMDGRFGMENVSQKLIGDFEAVEGNYQFIMNEIKDLRVIHLPPLPESTTSTKKDDDKSNPGGGASSSASTATSN